jgi:transposase
LEVTPRRVRRWRSISEKLKIVQLSFEPGVSLAEVARVHRVNANQVFTWRRAFERGELSEPSVALIPVTVSNPGDERREPEAETSAGGAIHIELPGQAVISVERGADVVLLRSILESLRQSPSHHRSFTMSPRRPRNTNTCPENGCSCNTFCTCALSPSNPRRRSVTGALHNKARRDPFVDEPENACSQQWRFHNVPCSPCV